eukprot:scaffold28973_cov34-Phaeocystis_antarctica.AAC.1
MARLFGTPAARPTVGLSVWRRREEGVTGETGPGPLWPGSSGFDGLRVQEAGEAGAGPLRHGTRLAAFYFTCRLGLKLGNNGTVSGKKGVPPAEPRDRPKPQ